MNKISLYYIINKNYYLLNVKKLTLLDFFFDSNLKFIVFFLNNFILIKL